MCRLISCKLNFLVLPAFTGLYRLRLCPSFGRAAAAKTGWRVPSTCRAYRPDLPRIGPRLRLRPRPQIRSTSTCSSTPDSVCGHLISFGILISSFVFGSRLPTILTEPREKACVSGLRDFTGGPCSFSVAQRSNGCRERQKPAAQKMSCSQECVTRFLYPTRRLGLNIFVSRLFNEVRGRSAQSLGCKSGKYTRWLPAPVFFRGDLAHFEASLCYLLVTTVHKERAGEFLKLQVVLNKLLTKHFSTP